MKKFCLYLVSMYLMYACNTPSQDVEKDHWIASGQMPCVAKDSLSNIHLVFGNGDSILYINSTDKGNSFSAPTLVALLPGFVSSHMRGAQIAATKSGILIIAVNEAGDILSFFKNGNGPWINGQKLNDRDTIAKEGFISLSADGDKVFAVWLDLRNNLKNNIYGAGSADGGKSWSSNKMIYTSPDSSVCECCKPSVLAKNNHVYVMFRNWLQGNRDLYLATSSDNGNKFDTAQKLGKGNWKIDGCPMDGGALTIDDNDVIQTVWRRENKIYNASPGSVEKEIGAGKGCTIETVNGSNVYAWSDNGNVVFADAEGHKRSVGKGSLPILKRLDSEIVLCVYENDKEIHTKLIAL